MPQLLDIDIQTKEVLDWKGVHLMHMMMSSCSQKTRIFLNLKGVPWESHDIKDIPGGNWGEWFLGINPRGLVPVLIHDGAVHIESNDILLYLDKNFSGPALIPSGKEIELEHLLKQEDDLHLDLRALSIRYMFGVEMALRDDERLKAYRDTGSGTVQGKADNDKLAQIEFWQTLRKDGITDDRVKLAVNNFRQVFERFEETLSEQPYLLGSDITLIDIAWYIYTNRLNIVGYPFAKLHPNVDAWFHKLNARKDFAKECITPPFIQPHVEALKTKNEADGTTLSLVAGIE
ncbi:MAG: glutathione S-transferase family protein [Paraglaciecola sp.]|uniref:glutathione S-transferase family protein n=1 Tax=Paraglaciecola sp. TaxID=1920173 RepID=UPI003299C997